MDINTQFGKLLSADEGATFLQFAPKELDNGIEHISCPTEQNYLDYGYKKIVINDPSTYIGQYMQVGYDETDTQLVAKFDLAPIPSEPSASYSKYKIIKLCMQLGIWTELKSCLEKSGLMDLFNAAIVFKSDDSFFKQGLQLVKSRYGYSDELLGQFLESCLSDD